MDEINETEITQEPIPVIKPEKSTVWYFYLLTGLGLILILAAGLYFRTVGIKWDDDQHLHPDERFLTMVASAVQPVKNLAAYFDTNNSTLNPHNVGYGFYVYGTLPLFIVRYVAEWTNKADYGSVYVVGRYLSGFIDLLTVLLVFLTAYQLYKRLGLGLLAAAFSAFSVLQIQISHYFVVDNFITFFSFLAVYFATFVFTAKPSRKVVSKSEPVPVVLDTPDVAIEENPVENAAPVLPEIISEEKKREPSKFERALSEGWGKMIPYVLFGIALGLAMASKISAAPLAILLPAAALVYFSRVEKERRSIEIWVILRNLVIAAIVAFLVFRIFQPYAFSGPGFLGLKLNPRWLENMKEIANQSGGDVDFPPALQWARRPVTFAWQNMVEWGMGLPLGLLAWAGFIWMAWRMIKGEWKQHILLWGWTALYFTWQSINFTRSMRYQLPVYPTLMIIAAWMVSYFWERKKDAAQGVIGFLKSHGSQVLSAVLGIGVLGATAAYAFAFTRIYTRPVTRVAASEWIYQNVPAPINLHIDTAVGVRNQPLVFPHETTVTVAQPVLMEFQPQTAGSLMDVVFEHIRSEAGDVPKTMIVKVFEKPDSTEPLAIAMLSSDFNTDNDPRGVEYKLLLDTPLPVEKDQSLYLSIETMGESTELILAGTLTVGIITPDSIWHQPLPDPVDALHPGQNYTQQFTAVYSGDLKEVYLPYVEDWENNPSQKTLRFSIYRDGQDEPLGVAEVKGDFAPGSDRRGQPYLFVFDQPIAFKADDSYRMRLEFVEGSGTIAAYGSKHVNESSWDDVLPVNLHGYNPYDYRTGLYRTDLNFEMYWDDNTDKRERFISNLEQADYIFTSSNRQWGTTVRVPERYPMTTLYYRNLLGCPEDKDIFWCYAVAQPGMFQGKLGFDLVYVNQSDPNLGSLRFNSQFAEEAFTVYDAPKVMIFRKNASYDSASVHALFYSVDLDKVVHLTPHQASNYPGNLMLSPERAQKEAAGGTWSDLINRNSFFNKYPFFDLLAWYLVVMVLSWVMYPFTRFALKGLADKGYPLARMVAFLLLAYFTWLAGSLGVDVTSWTISAVVLFLVLVNAGLFYLQRKAIIEDIKKHWKYILLVEILILAFFVFFLLIRIGNPDLWHTSKGGEKPMDFSYFNAVIKSTNYPPYDPWMAGGYMNYYYYGFVLAAVIVKWLGIVPSIAYNLILPTWFSLLAIGAFSVGWNLLSLIKIPEPKKEEQDQPELQQREPQPTDEETAEQGTLPLPPVVESGLTWFNKLKNRVKATWQWLVHLGQPLIAGLVSSVGLLMLGNLGTVRMIWHGWIKLGKPGVEPRDLSFIQHYTASFKGFILWLSGTPFPYPQGDWYWIPSRVYPNEPITEFPLFTFLYGDPHAHMFALPVTVLVIAWLISILRAKWEWGDEEGRFRWLQFAASMFLGALAIGSLRPINTWDLPTYLALGVVVILYTAIKYANIPEKYLAGLSQVIKRISIAVVASGLLVGLSFLLYQPYAHWYGQGYNAVDFWKGDHSPFWSYITHWGLFLFVIISWMVWETRDWMAKTPVSSLKKLQPYVGLIILAIASVVALSLLLVFKKVQIGWFTLPLATWAGVLILRKGQPDAKRLVLFMIGTALVLTLAVELIVLRGDIGRMNTVFKFYLQAWVLLSLSAGASLVWLLPSIRDEWVNGWKISWQAVFGVLVVSAAMFTLLAGADKIRDRMSRSAPHGLDGMTYMMTSTYSDEGVDMDLEQDYQAIRWMQDNVEGSPVIVEANTVEYRWGSRFTIYTGLPGVVGWNWHQRQQRAITPSEWVTNRVEEIGTFYRTDSRAWTVDFLQRYNVRYIIVGQLEKAYYSGVGLDKFSAWNGDLWQEVYRDRDTVIYQVQ
jgi:YYY domain-containing protein